MDDFDDEELGRSARRLRVATLVGLRWLAIVGQSVAVLVAHFALQVVEDREAHVEAHQVGELERTHGVAVTEAKRLVDVGGRGHLLLEHADGLHSQADAEAGGGEAGRVAHNLSYNPFSEMHPVGGIGIRAIAEPFVVGFVDIGWGGEGAAVFSGINYPF